jgi:hypothetical protein
MKSSPITTQSPPVNWSNFLEQLVRDYETPPAKGLAHGLQKDAIQNGWGARDGSKKFRFEIQLLNKAKPKPLLILTDRGTVGLTGDVFEAHALPDPIPATQRLARFESMFESGAQEGPGLFGRGKLIFNASSKDGLILYDSLTKSGEYRFNFRGISGRQYEHFTRVREADEAKRELQTRTRGSLSPLTEPGTRIVIVNPHPDVVEAIEAGDLHRAIEETWWEIVQKYDADIRISSDSGKSWVATVPSEYGGLPKEHHKGWKVLHSENIQVEIDRRGHRIKRIHLLLPPAGHKVREELRGVSVHRKGMKVGDVRLSAVPPEIEDRFFGYVELDQQYEDLISNLENTTHYGFASLHKAPYRVLRQQVQDRFDDFLERLGLRKKSKDPEERMRRALEDAQSELNSILHDLGVPSFGAGTESKNEFAVSVEDLTFPENSNYVQTGDAIEGFFFRVRNLAEKENSAWVEIETYERDAGVIETLYARRRLDFGSNGEHRTGPFTIQLSSSKYPSQKKIACVCKVTDAEKKELARKTFYLYLDLEPEAEAELARIGLKAAKWPRAYSRRVDFGEEITGLRYEVENLTGKRMKARIRLRTLWGAEGNAPIDDAVGAWDVDLNAFESVEVGPSAINASQAMYQDVGRGQINIRCHAVALETTKEWERGTKLAEHTMAFFLNTDPSVGFFEFPPEYFEGGLASPRSAVQSSGRAWKLRINTTHPAFVVSKDDDIRARNYLFEQMAAQIAYVLVRTDQVKPLQRQLELDKIDTFADLSPDEIIERVAYRLTDRIVGSYYSE